MDTYYFTTMHNDHPTSHGVKHNNPNTGIQDPGWRKCDGCSREIYIVRAGKSDIGTPLFTVEKSRPWE